MLAEARGNTAIYLPECFEWLILKSGIIQRQDIPEILAHPADYIESAEFFSWEQFFTAALEAYTGEDDYRRYRKSSISEYYLDARQANRILSAMPEEIRRLLRPAR